MQLSVPTLPLDPNAQLSSDAKGFPSFGGKTDSKAAGRANFGEMLSAESRSEPSAPPAPSSSGVRPGAARKEKASPTSSDTEKAEPVAVAAVLVAETPVVTTPKAVEAELELTFLPPQPGVVTTGSETSTESTLADPSAAVPAHHGTGRAFVGDVFQAAGRADLRAYGRGGEGQPAVNGVRSSRTPTVEGTAGSLPAVSLPAEPFSRTPVSTPAANSVVTQQTQTPVNALFLAGTAQDAPLVEPLAALSPPASEISASTTAGEHGPQGRAGTDASADLFSPGDHRNGPSLEGASTPAPASPFEVAQPAEPVGAELEASELPILNEAVPTPTDTPAETVKGSDRDRFAATMASTEKIAADLHRLDSRGSPRGKSSEIVPLATEQSYVTGEVKSVGINAAKPETLMSAAAATPTLTPLAPEHASLNVSPLSFDALVKEGSDDAGSQVALARRAVESVLTAADSLATGEQRSVRLQFTVGGEELAVRVEFRGEKIHTTFRTDSSELRSALAHEWQSVSAVQAGVRTQRLADPVFASNSSANGQSFSSDSGAAQHRDSAPRNPHGSPDEIFGARRAFSNTTAVAAPASTAPAAVAAHGSNPLRLHTFA